MALMLKYFYGENNMRFYENTFKGSLEYLSEAPTKRDELEDLSDEEEDKINGALYYAPLNTTVDVDGVKYIKTYSAGWMSEDGTPIGMFKLIDIQILTGIGRALLRGNYEN